MSNLLLAEYDYHVQDFISRGLHINGEWIALGPGAMWALDQKGFDYKIPEDFYREEELEKTCLDVHEKIEDYFRKIDNIIHQEYPAIKELGISPFLFNIYQLTIIFDGLVSRIFQLKSILNNFPRYHIHVHSGQALPEGSGVLNFSFSTKETLWGRVLSLPDFSHSLLKSIHTITTHPANVTKRNYKESCRSMIISILSKSLIINHIMLHFRSNDIQGIFGLVKNKRTLMIHNGWHEWAYTIDSLRKSGWRIISTNDAHFNHKLWNDNKQDMEYSSRMLDAIKKHTEGLNFLGVSLFSIVSERIRRILNTLPHNISKIAEETHKIIKKYQVAGILTSVSPSCVSHIITQSGRYLNVPVFRWQHGLINFNKRISQQSQYNDLMTSDVVFAFGGEIERAYQHYHNQFSPHVIPVGSANLDIIRNKDKFSKSKKGSSGKKKILYVTTSYYENDWNLAFSAAFSDRHLYRTQLTIMNSLEEISSRNDFSGKITVKLYPHKYHDPPWLEAFQATNKIKFIKDEINFTDLLFLNDIIIIDFPSTTLLQSISSHKMVFVLTKYIPFPDHMIEMLKKRAVCSTSTDGLMEKLKSFVKTNIYPANVNNNEFLMEYGNYRDDGKSVVRALSAINDYN